MRYCIQQATSLDVAILATALEERPDTQADDRGLMPADRLRHTCASSAQIWTARNRHDGLPVVLWGVSPHAADPEVGQLWMLASEPFNDDPAELRSLSRLVLSEMLGEFPRLENYIDARKDRALDLMRSIGFTVEPGIHQLASGRTFHKVWIDSSYFEQESPGHFSPFYH